MVVLRRGNQRAFNIYRAVGSVNIVLVSVVRILIAVIMGKAATCNTSTPAYSKLLLPTVPKLLTNTSYRERKIDR